MELEWRKRLSINTFIFSNEESGEGGIELSKGARARERVCTSRPRYTHVIAGHDTYRTHVHLIRAP